MERSSGRTISGSSPRRPSAADLGSAIRSILERPADERRAWRRRIAATSATEFGWPAYARAYGELVEELRPPAAR